MNDQEGQSSNEQLAALFLRLVTRELATPASDLEGKFRTLDKESDPWKAREEIQDLSGSIDHLSRLIETLSDTADIEARRVRLDITEIDLAHLLSECISRRLQCFPTFRFLPDIPARLEIQGDKTRLTFLIDDLLDAAIHITPDGGIIHTLLAREEEQIILTTCNRDAELSPARFKSFVDWMAEDVKNPGLLRGAGIGLYRSYRTALMLGGELELSASPEGGASFTVRLPASDAPPPPSS